MKIEKINDNQIRCTLTRDDLAQRQLKLSELAYGSEKAKSLFREMMQQAASEFGFESDNLPLMIEAIPTAGDSIVLNITKVDEPSVPPVRLFSFSRLDSVIHASHFLAEMYDGPNTLYKDEAENMYILTLAQGEHPSSDFNRICNMLSEYGSPEQGGGISLAFLEEHCDMILAKNAIQTLTSFK